ncbi:hypothetical protein OG777_17210 [Micromonospora peucetia]|uniref:hypothetical protein n=1 Tax=Micromonospora peucetia TaxID=47871 RepID=UPI0022508549|nr:hypothetical protein [Micromonospora peucetia]MCX4388661.1 hypothetical protein [Micromonospora peucetia]
MTSISTPSGAATMKCRCPKSSSRSPSSARSPPRTTSRSHSALADTRAALARMLDALRTPWPGCPAAPGPVGGEVAAARGGGVPGSVGVTG